MLRITIKYETRHSLTGMELGTESRIIGLFVSLCNVWWKLGYLLELGAT